VLWRTALSAIPTTTLHRNETNKSETDQAEGGGFGSGLYQKVIDRNDARIKPGVGDKGSPNQPARLLKTKEGEAAIVGGSRRAEQYIIGVEERYGLAVYLRLARESGKEAKFQYALLQRDVDEPEIGVITQRERIVNAEGGVPNLPVIGRERVNADCKWSGIICLLQS